MKKTMLTLALLLHGFLLLGQQPLEFGQLSQEERAFTTYGKDSTAHAIYLYEKGDNTFEVRTNRLWLIKKYHAKIKILDPKGFSWADVAIPYYHANGSSEKVLGIRAITHNGSVKHSVLKESIFDVDSSENWSMIKFTFPQVELGSILEYTYEIQSPYMFHLNGWSFQESIPKLYSQYNAKIPGLYAYNRALYGDLELSVNFATVLPNCFYQPGSTTRAVDCEVLQYSMEDVPAFETDGEFMLSPENYRSRLEFELAEYRGFGGQGQKFTQSWEDVDKEFRTDKDIGGQLRKRNYFERNVPLDLISGEGDALAKARGIHQFVKAHYSWNGKFGIFRDNRVKQAFDAKTGNVAEINITLINLLNAAGIETDLMLLSTRDNGLPKKIHPVMGDFNYVVARTEIDGTVYLLDATEKELPFGMLPYRCLNYYGRVMDMEKGSYWQDILPEEKNGKLVRLQLELDLDAQVGTGSYQETSLGHDALRKRGLLETLGGQEYLEAMQAGAQDEFYIEAHQVDGELSDEKKLVEKFDFEIEGLQGEKTVFFNPFLVRFHTTNPFKAEKRNHPVDFGYPRSYTYMANIKLPPGYRVKELPEPVNLGLPEQSGTLRLQYNQAGDAIVMMFSLQLKHAQYTSVGYPYIKKFFETAVDIQNKNYIVFERE